MIEKTFAYELWPRHQESPAECVVVRYYKGKMNVAMYDTNWDLVHSVVGRVGGRYVPNDDWWVVAITVHEGDWLDFGTKAFSMVVETRYQPQQPLMIS